MNTESASRFLVRFLPGYEPRLGRLYGPCKGYALPPSPPTYLMGPRDYPGGPTTKPEKVSKYVRFIYPDELLDATTIAPCVSTTEKRAD